MFTQDQYAKALQQLLPPGAAWSRQLSSDLYLLCRALAKEFERISGREDDLVDEADPRKTDELVADWERALGLPDPCAAAPTSLADRRNAITARLTLPVEGTAAYYVALALQLGYLAASIEQQPPFSCESGCDDPLNGVEIIFFWIFNTLLQGEPMDSILECLLAARAPAHTLPGVRFLDAGWGKAWGRHWGGPGDVYYGWGRGWGLFWGGVN